MKEEELLYRWLEIIIECPVEGCNFYTLARRIEIVDYPNRIIPAGGIIRWLKKGGYIKAEGVKIDLGHEIMMISISEKGREILKELREKY